MLLSHNKFINLFLVCPACTSVYHMSGVPTGSIESVRAPGSKYIRF